MNQSAVWSDVESVCEEVRASAPTRAYEDAFRERAPDVEGWIDMFPPVPGQTGILVVSAGQLAGIELAGGPGMYARLHRRLLAPYIFDALAAGLDLGSARTEGGAGERAPGAPRRAAKVGAEDSACEGRADEGRHAFPDGVDIFGAPYDADGEGEWDAPGREPRPRVEAVRRSVDWLGHLMESVCEARPSLGLGRDLRYATKELIGGGLEHAGRLVYLTAYDGRGRQ